MLLGIATIEFVHCLLHVKVVKSRMFVKVVTTKCDGWLILKDLKSRFKISFLTLIP
jgi:hypothetical protein